MNYFAKRIIPCLDVDNGRVVKGVNFVGLRDIMMRVQMRLHFLTSQLPIKNERQLSIL